jgi:CelD/BcsL family acetyltransferase involved in cellulose biosynthesis
MNAATTPAFVVARPQRAFAYMGAEIITDFEDLAADWTRLWEESTSATIFQSLPWIRAWWKAFHHDAQLFAPVVREGETIAGILPLVRNRGGLRFLGTPGADYCDILCREAVAPDVITAALHALLNRDDWRTCCLSNLRNNSQLVRHAAHLPADILRHMCLLPMTRRSALVLRQNREDVIAAMRRKPALRRHRNKLYRCGKVDFRHLETRAEAHRLLRTLFAQHIGRRALTGGHSQFLTPEWRNFYAALVDELDPGNELRFSVLELDGRPVACHFGFECNGSLILYKPTFDVDLSELSPGDVLLSELLGYACERRLDEVDFTIGREAYKEHFVNDSSDVFRVMLDHGLLRANIRRLLQPKAIRLTECKTVATIKSHVVSGVRWLEAQRLRCCRAARLGRVWNTRLIYRREAGTGKCATNVASQVQVACLQDLASLAIEHPHLYGTKLFQEYQGRLRRGDRCYLLRSFQRQQHLAWTRRVTLPTCAREASSLTEMQAEILYDFRSVSDQPGVPISREVVEWFVGHADDQGLLACICLAKKDVGSRRVIESAGFKCRCVGRWLTKDRWTTELEASR